MKQLKRRVMFNLLLAAIVSVLSTHVFAGTVYDIAEAGISGGLVAQVGSDGLDLQKLGDRFHVRLLLKDSNALAKAREEIEKAGLAGRFTASHWKGGSLPFADRVVNVLIIPGNDLVDAAEIKRVLAPGGLSIVDGKAEKMPVPDTIDDWTHYHYDASGNAVSKDKEVGPPRSFRWWATPMHLRSHNYSASFTGLVSADGRIFHILDEGTYLLDQGGATPKFSLVARDAFNGALLWKKPLEGYGQPFYEDVAGQAVRDYIWRTPLSMNRRLVAVDDKVYAALKYRGSPLAILDSATGKLLHEVDLGGVDEIVADGNLVICRVRPEIPMPTDEMRGKNRGVVETKLEKEGYKNPRQELRSRVYDRLRENKNEQIVAVDAANGEILWRVDAPLVGTQCLALADGKVVYHNYEEMVALDAKRGGKIWSYAAPAERGSMPRNLLGNLLIADSKVFWTSTNTGGGVCLNLSDGKELWRKERTGTTGGFGFPTALRSVKGTLYWDYLRRTPLKLADGTDASRPDIGDMLTRGHHIRCFAGKATERYLITPHRGTEFIDLEGDNHMVCDWTRGACSYGLMPANGLIYNTPDPCSCYEGALINGFIALAPHEPGTLAKAPAADAPERLTKGPAYGTPFKTLGSPLATSTTWPCYRADARRSAFTPTKLSSKLQTAWTADPGGDLTQATIADDRAFVVRKNNYELICLSLSDGKTIWIESFPAALDGPPTIVDGRLYLGCRDGSVHCLRAADGATAWVFQAAPLERLTLSGDRLENLWPVSSSVLYHNGLIYAPAGRSSYLDGGIHLYALDPATGAVKHHTILEGPWPDRKTLRTAVVYEPDRVKAEKKGPEALAKVDEAINEEWATGYSVYGGVADLLVTDGKHIYMTQNQFDPNLKRIPKKRKWRSGYTPMDGHHMMVGTGFLDDSMFHRTFMVYDDAWPAYGSGPGSAARGGTVVAVGKNRSYAAQHFVGGGYAFHKPGSGNRIVADNFETENLPGMMIDKETVKRNKLPWYHLGGKSFSRERLPLWTTATPVVIRSILCANDPSTGSGQAGGELVFTAGIVEGKTRAEWDKSTYFIGPGKLQIFNGVDGKLLAEYDLPACPVFDGMSAADGKLLIPMVNGQLQCIKIKD